MHIPSTAAVLLAGMAVFARSDTPTINLYDPRFLEYVPAGTSDSRSPCPALNALANHGFLPHSGRNVNIASIILATFLGLGVSPEVSGFIAAVGMASSSKPWTLSFDLEDLRNHMFLIEHDCSFSRQDALVGNNNVFNSTLWKVALKELPEASLVTAFDVGKAKSARIQDDYLRNPHAVYGPRAAAFGAIEAGLFLSALGSPVPGFADLSYVRSFFEQEKLPYDLGWRPLLESNNVFTVLGLAVAALAADPAILTDTLRVALDTPSDIVQTIVPPNQDFLANLTEVITGLGFDSSVLDGLATLL